MTYQQYGPPQQFMWIPDSLIGKIRTMSMRVGATSVVVSLVVGIVAVWWGGRLPIADHPMASFTTILTELSAFFSALSGVAMMLGRKYIAQGFVDVWSTRRACRLALVFWIAAIVLGVLSGLNLMLVAGSAVFEGQAVGAEAAAFLRLPAVLVVVTGVLFFVARWLLRPSPALLRQHYYPTA